MGSVNSRSKAPPSQPVQQIVYRTPEPVTPIEPIKTDDEVSAESRTSSLLRRSRGRFGTILTSFRGVLTAKENDRKTSKTLLGE